MKDYSLAPYCLDDMGKEVKRIGDLVNVECILCETPSLRAQGYFSTPQISKDMVRIASKFGISMKEENDLELIGRNLQSLIVALREKGVQGI